MSREKQTKKKKIRFCRIMLEDSPGGKYWLKKIDWDASGNTPRVRGTDNMHLAMIFEVDEILATEIAFVYNEYPRAKVVRIGMREALAAAVEAVCKLSHEVHDHDKIISRLDSSFQEHISTADHKSV